MIHYLWSMNSEESTEKIARESKTSELEDNNAETKKVGQGEYASVKDSPKGNQLKNADDFVGTA
jgi:hypothetical protein